MESHTQIKPLKCNICQDSFLLRCDLSDHKKIHSKQYQCDQCYVFFDQKVGLDKHMLKHVGSEIPLISVKEEYETVDESQVMSDHSSKIKETDFVDYCDQNIIEEIKHEVLEESFQDPLSF